MQQPEAADAELGLFDEELQLTGTQGETHRLEMGHFPHYHHYSV